jgi:hypothetical protein
MKPQLQKALLAVAVLTLWTCPCVDAAVSFTVDLDASTPDVIDSERSIVSGQDITGAIIFETDGSPSIGGFNLDLLFDGSSASQGPLSLRGFSAEARENGDAVGDIDTNRVQTFPAVLISLNPLSFRSLGALSDSGDEPDFTEGAFEGIAAGAPDLPFNQPFSGRIFEFTLTGTGLTESLVDNVSFGGEGVLFAGESSPVGAADSRVTFNGARLNVIAIPEPSSLAMLATAVGIAGLRRRRS